jgi:hypothetical protein
MLGVDRVDICVFIGRGTVTILSWGRGTGNGELAKWSGQAERDRRLLNGIRAGMTERGRVTTTIIGSLFWFV